jgi:hypothetical protein
MKYIYLLFVLACFSACQYNYPQLSNTSSLSNFPMPPSHQRAIELIQAGTLPTDTAFVRLVKLEVKGRPDMPDSIWLNRLKEKAQAEGADAILLEPKRRESKTTLYAGTAIRYKNHLGYVRAYLKWQKVYSITAGIPTHALTVAYDFDRYIWKVIPEKMKDADTLFYEFEDRYSPYHLLEEKNNWTHRTDKSGRDVMRNYFVNGSLVKKCIISYPEKDLIRVTINYYGAMFEVSPVDVVIFRINEKKQIVESLIGRSDGMFFKEYFKYDDIDRLASTTLFRINKQKEELFLASQYEYFTPEDFF